MQNSFELQRNFEFGSKLNRSNLEFGTWSYSLELQLIILMGANNSFFTSVSLDRLYKNSG